MRREKRQVSKPLNQLISKGQKTGKKLKSVIVLSRRSNVRKRRGKEMKKDEVERA